MATEKDKAMKTARKIANLEQAISLQERTLANLQKSDQIDNGENIRLSKRLLTIMRANLAGLIRIAATRQLNADMSEVLRDARELTA